MTVFELHRNTTFSFKSDRFYGTSLSENALIGAFCWIATLIIVILKALLTVNMLTPKIDWPVIMTYSDTDKGPEEPSNGWWPISYVKYICYV